MGRANRTIVALLAVSVASCSLFTHETPSEGRPRETARRTPCPSEMAYVPATTDNAHAFCIDRWEGATVEIGASGEASHPPFLPVTNLKVTAISRAGAVPQGYISKNEAEAACTAAHKRLCAGEEWQRACRGEKPTKFPYGDERKAGYCNDSGHAPLAQLYPALGEDVFGSHEAMNDPRINKAPHTVAPSGRFSKCKSGFGVFDMVGNLHEWTAEMNGTRGVFRGGYYQDTHLNGDGCNYKTTAHDVSYHDYSTGFRCCADPR